MMNLLTGQELLGATRRRYRLLTIPEDFPELAGKQIRLRSLSAREKAEYEAFFDGADGQTDTERAKSYREKLISETVVDDSDRKQFTPEDVAALGEVDAALLTYIYEAARDLTLVDLRQLAKNLPETPAPDSP